MNWEKIRKRLVYPLLLVVLTFGVLEVGLRVAYAARNAFVKEVALPYVINHGYAAFPPWADRMRILRHDEFLMWRLQPNVSRLYVDVFTPVPNEQDRIDLARRFLPKTPEWIEGNPSWRVDINSSGFRDEEFPEAKRDDEIRILSFGDSWTFGMNVGQQESYPQQLEAKLRALYPDRPVEVFNMGVLGYTTFQGKRNLERYGLPLEPDFVTFAFGQNDGQFKTWKDSEQIEYNASFRARGFRTLSRSEVVKMLYYFLQRMRNDYTPIDHRIRFQADQVERAKQGGENAPSLDYLRVPPDEYEQNLVDMITASREAGADAILLYNEMAGESGSPLFVEMRYRAILESISERLDVPLVDSSAIIAAARGDVEARVEVDLGLVPPAPEPVEGGQPAEPEESAVDVVFRVYMDRYEVDDVVYVAGTDAQLGDIVPNKIRMYDDGTHGDQVAGDDVWSFTASFAPGSDVFYVYTNSGDEGVWNGVDLPDVRHASIRDEPGGVQYLPVDTFGKVYLQADSWHPDAFGYGLIADGLTEAVVERLSPEPVGSE